MEGNTPVQHVLIGTFLVSLATATVVRGMSPLVDTNGNFVAKKFQTALNQQDLQSILSSIEKRLATLDAIYSTNPSLERKFDQFTRRLHLIDTKLIMLESVMQASLEKISENISTKNFKDDMTQVSLFSKLDTLYEGISHRITHIDKKHDSAILKTQGKIENVLTKLEKMEDNLTSRDESIESELAETITAVEDLRTSCSLVEHNLINYTKSYIQGSIEEIINNKNMHMPHKLILEEMKNIQKMIHLQLEDSNSTKDVMQEFKLELKEDLNNYANKVADMNSEIWRSDDTIETKIYAVEANINDTRLEMKNNFKNVIQHLSKAFNGKNSIPNDYSNDAVGLDDINANLNHNFEKLLSTQNLFLESCHRLQNDESQIESKISDLLEKLIETFEQKASLEMKDIQNVEKLIKSHDSLVRRQLNLNTRNLVTIYNQSHMNRLEIESCIDNVKNGIQELFGTILTISKNTNENNSVLFRHLQAINNKLLQFEKQNTNMEYLLDIKKILSKLELETTNEIKQHLQKIHKDIEDMHTKIEKHLQEQSNNLDKKIDSVLKFIAYKNNTITNQTEGNLNTTESDINLLVNQIFVKNFPPNNNVTFPEVTNYNKTKPKCLPNYLGKIDVRYNNQSDINCEESTQVNETKNELNCNYLALIDVRNNNNNTGNCTKYFENITDTTTNDNTSTINLIDVRYNSNFSNSTQFLNNTKLSGEININRFINITNNTQFNTPEFNNKTTPSSIEKQTVIVEDASTTISDNMDLERLEKTEDISKDLELEVLNSNNMDDFV